MGLQWFFYDKTEPLTASFGFTAVTFELLHGFHKEYSEVQLQRKTSKLSVNYSTG